MLIAFWAIHIAAVMSPGPSFIVVLRTAVAESRMAGIAVALGLGLGTLVWAVAAWFGLSALFAVAPWLFDVMRYAGALFLVFLAVMLWRHARDPVTLEPGAGGKAGNLRAAIRLGLLTQFANPKVAIFFGTIFLVALPPDPSVMVLIAVFAIVFLNEFCWYALVALVMAAGPVRARYARSKPMIDRVTGTFLGALGLRLLVD
jgi:threonine/homoserine/homoserine lactone efflux protein